MKKDIVLPASFTTLNKFVEDFKKRYKDKKMKERSCVMPLMPELLEEVLQNFKDKDGNFKHKYILDIICIDSTVPYRKLQKEFKNYLKFMKEKIKNGENLDINIDNL